MKFLQNISYKIISSIEKDFKFSKYTIDSGENEINVYMRENKDFVLCVNFTNLNSYINSNKAIHKFFSSKGIKYSLVNIFIVSSIQGIENTYFQTDVYEEAIFIEEETGKIKSFNVHSVGLLNHIKNICNGSKKHKSHKNNHITMSIILLVILLYFILGTIAGDISSIRDEVLLWAGAKMDVLIKSGEYHRLFLSAFMHKNFVQLIVGIITLFFTGSIVEKNIGKLKYIILIFLGIFFGNFSSYVFNFSNVFGVGLYIINYALIGSLFILAFKHRHKVNKLFFIFIFSLIGINLVNSMFLTNIDNFGSLASFIIGIIFTKLIYSFKK